MESFHFIVIRAFQANLFGSIEILLGLLSVLDSIFLTKAHFTINERIHTCFVLISEENKISIVLHYTVKTDIRPKNNPFKVLHSILNCKITPYKVVTYVFKLISVKKMDAERNRKVWDNNLKC